MFMQIGSLRKDPNHKQASIKLKKKIKNQSPRIPPGRQTLAFQSALSTDTLHPTVNESERIDNGCHEEATRRLNGRKPQR